MCAHNLGAAGFSWWPRRRCITGPREDSHPHLWAQQLGYTAISTIHYMLLNFYGHTGVLCISIHGFINTYKNYCLTLILIFSFSSSVESRHVNMHNICILTCINSTQRNSCYIHIPSGPLILLEHYFHFSCNSESDIYSYIYAVL